MLAAWIHSGNAHLLITLKHGGASQSVTAGSSVSVPVEVASPVVVVASVVLVVAGVSVVLVAGVSVLVGVVGAPEVGASVVPMAGVLPVEPVVLSSSPAGQADASEAARASRDEWASRVTARSYTDRQFLGLHENCFEASPSGRV